VSNWLPGLEARRERLEQLLSESADAAARREHETFDRAIGPCAGRILIYGAGGLGRRVLRGLRVHGDEPLAFLDRNSQLWGQTVEGLPVISPEDAVRRFGADSAILIAVWNPEAAGGVPSIAAWLRAAGCLRIVPFAWLFWKYPADFLPNYLWDLPSKLLKKGSEVRQGFALLDGARSQCQFLDHVQFRLTGDFSCLKPPESDPQYFPARLIRPRADEYFVDCGAFNGDSTLEFAEWAAGRFRKVLAFEPDPANFAALQRTVTADGRLRGRVVCVPKAVGLREYTLRFQASGLGSASASPSGELEVSCVPLDEALADECPTYIKMDIEGAELDALSGAAAVLRENRPTLAICAYHTQDHLWRVPRRIRDLMPDARLVLRPHCVDGFDLVCYAIPPEREADFSGEDDLS
jgi:FkbM family methyltransferase